MMAAAVAQSARDRSAALTMFMTESEATALSTATVAVGNA